MYQTSLLNPPTRKVTLPWNGAICKSIIVPIVHSVRVLGFQKCESLGSHLNAPLEKVCGKRDQPGIMAAKSLAGVALGRQKQPLTQECIPVGCIPSAAVAICWGRRGGGGVCPLADFLTHACENIIFPQLRLRTVMTLRATKYHRETRITDHCHYSMHGCGGLLHAGVNFQESHRLNQ